jgi:hypothetical protein
MWIILGFSFVTSTIFFAPFLKYRDAETDKKNAVAALNDKSPKLEGFIDQWIIHDEAETTNLIIIPQLHINNFGGSGSVAENFKLKLILGTNALDAEPIDIPDYYEWKTIKNDEITVFRLFRPDLISEKASSSIEVGSAPRGWLAYRLPGISVAQLKTKYSIVISFMDVGGNEIFVTNGIWRGEMLTNTESFYIPRTLPGSVNMVYTNYQVQSDFANGWVPPELPPGCSNVVIYLGANAINYSRLTAEISPDSGTMFAIKDLPDFYLQNLDKSPGYSPRQKYMWLKDWMTYSVGGKTVPYPVQPVIISNRLYIEVEIPFSNAKRKLIMSDDFDPQLPIPPNWDRNYSTNYYSDGITSGGVYAYEIVNELTNPVLQVVYSSPSEVHVNGIFQVDQDSILATFGQPPQLLSLQIIEGSQTNGMMAVSLENEHFHDMLSISSNDTASSIGEKLTNEFFRPIFKYQRPIFKYPSNRNLGALSDWVSETNKSDSKILDNHK